jgi:hypothetical protein
LFGQNASGLAQGNRVNLAPTRSGVINETVVAKTPPEGLLLTPKSHKPPAASLRKHKISFS